jgi:hypothetical protein
MLAAGEVVRRVLKRRLARAEAAIERDEAAFERDFSDRVDEEFPRLLEEESE